MLRFKKKKKKTGSNTQEWQITQKRTRQKRKIIAHFFSQKSKNEWQINMAKGLSITSNQINEKQENKIPTHICTCFFSTWKTHCVIYCRHILLTGYIFFLVSLHPLKGPKSNDTLIAISTSSTKILVSKSLSLLKGASTSCKNG